jgi:hypothetical protein
VFNRRPSQPSVEEIIQEAMKKWKLSKPKAREAYRDAQKRTGNDKWSVTRRPPRDILQDRAERAGLEKVPLI